MVEMEHAGVCCVDGFTEGEVDVLVRVDVSRVGLHVDELFGHRRDFNIFFLLGFLLSL